MTAAVSLVVAVAANGAIGMDGGLPWRLPGDLAFFKRTTLGKPVLMGRKTWESLPRKPLPGRPNLVITRDPAYQADGAEVNHSLESALSRGQALAAEIGAEEVCIIGGADLYRQALPFADRLYLTEVAARPDADTFFPDFDRSQWHEVWREPGPEAATDAPPAPRYDFVLLTRS